MPAIKTVKETEADPKTGKPRAKSGVAFPYWDLESVIEVARAVHERAGGLADNSQLATLLGYSGIRNGSFRTKSSAARMYGVIEDTDDGRIRVSQRGRAIIAPVSPADAARARVEAFLSVDLFKRVFDQFNGSTLPERIGLQNLLENEYQVVKDRVIPTVRIMLDSADQAGLFSVAGNRTRMVMPLTGATPPSTASLSTAPGTDAPPVPRYGGGNGSGGGDDSGIDPAIVGLLKRLPPVGTPMTEKRRKTVVDAFTSVIAVLYPDANDTP